MSHMRSQPIDDTRTSVAYICRSRIDNYSRALQDDFVDFGDMEDRRQLAIEEHEDYYKLTDILIKNNEETQQLQRNINYQTKDIQNTRHRLKHVTNRYECWGAT